MGNQEYFNESIQIKVNNVDKFDEERKNDDVTNRMFICKLPQKNESKSHVLDNVLIPMNWIVDYN